MKVTIVLACLFVVSFDAAAQPPDPVAKLVAKLSSKKAEERTEALAALADLGPKAESAIPVLASLLPTVDDEDRILATMALAKIGKASLPAVEKLLEHEDETTRYYAVWTLGLIGKHANAHTPKLLVLLETDPDEEVRVKAIYALARVAPDSKTVLAVFAKWASKQDDFASERHVVVDELRHFGPAALEPLVKAMADPFVAPKARESLEHLLNENKNDAFAKVVLPHLPRVLLHADPMNLDPSLGNGMVYFLAKHGDTLLPALEKDLDAKDARVRTEAAKTLVAIAANLASHVENPELVRKVSLLLLVRLKTADAKFRSVIASSMPYTEASAAAFDEFLIDDDVNLRMSAYSRMLQKGADPTPKLQERMQKAKGDAKIPFACALFTLTGDNSLGKVLWASIDSKDAGMRHRAACALVPFQFNPQETEKVKKHVVPVLVASLRSDNAERRMQAARQLLECSLHLRDHTAALFDRLDDPAPEVRSLVLSMLQNHVGVDPKASMRRLLPLLKDDDDQIRYGAAMALCSLGKAGVPHVAPLVHKDKSPQVWESVCMRLGMLKGEAKEAIPALLLALDDPARQMAAGQTILAIMPDKHFPVIWEGVLKHDKRLGKLTYPKAAYATPANLRDALLADWPKADAPRRRDIAHVLTALLPMIPANNQLESLKKLTPAMETQLKEIEKDMNRKDTKSRLDALEMLAQVKTLNVALQMNLLGSDLQKLDEKQAQEIHEAVQARSNKIDTLIRLARSDADLSVRRAARKADGTNAALFNPLVRFGPGFGPGFGPFNPFGPPGGFGRFDPFGLPGAFGPGNPLAPVH